MFTLRGVRKSFGSFVALSGIDLDLTPGTSTALIGPSGCGKSTLLRLLIGLIVPDAGEVWFAGTPITPAALPDLRRHVGYVIQEGGLFPHLSAKANITLMARQLRWTRAAIETRLAELLARTQISPDLLRRYPSELSGGQRQRVSLMRALMLDPDVLLLDEPLGALDPMIRYDLQQELRQLFADLKKTVLLVTHDMNEAAYLTDRLVLMRNGTIVQQGTPQQLLDQPADAFVQRFVAAQHPAK